MPEKVLKMSGDGLPNARKVTPAYNKADASAKPGNAKYKRISSSHIH
jgi:hypothetical protein